MSAYIAGDDAAKLAKSPLSVVRVFGTKSCVI